MTTPAPLYWSKVATGLGRVYHRPERRANRRDAWFWKVGKAADIAAILRRVRPFMRVKQHEATAFLIVALLRECKIRPTGPSPYLQGEQMAGALVRGMKRPGWETTAYEEALDLSCYLRQVLIERDDDKREAAGLPTTMAGLTGDRDALDSLNQIRDALGVPADTAWRTKAILEEIRSMLGQLERARRMLVNHGYDVDTHGMDGGLRAALAECRIDGDLLADAALNACPPWMANQAMQDLAAQVLVECARTGHFVITRGPNGEPWTPEPLAYAPVRCCEPAS